MGAVPLSHCCSASMRSPVPAPRAMPVGRSSAAVGAALTLLLSNQLLHAVALSASIFNDDQCHQFIQEGTNLNSGQCFALGKSSATVRHEMCCACVVHHPLCARTDCCLCAPCPLACSDCLRCTEQCRRQNLLRIVLQFCRGERQCPGRWRRDHLYPANLHRWLRCRWNPC